MSIWMHLYPLERTPGGSVNAHDGGVVDIEGLGDDSQAFAMEVPLPKNLADLMRGEFWLAT
jgi:hypothetical protein